MYQYNMRNDNSAMLSPNPFNPGSPIDPSDFVGRMQELENFRQKLRQTEQGSLASMAVAGGYGIGKTSFLHKCKSIAEENGALSIYFSLNEMDVLNRETLARMLIERLQEKVEEEVILNRISSRILSGLKKIKITIASTMEVELKEDVESQPFPNLHSALLSAWGNLKADKKAIVFLIDEARVLERNRADLVLYLRAVLEQLQIRKIPIMVVPGGKLTISGPSGSGFSPLVRTFPPVILENFTSIESKAFIRKKLEPVKISISDEVMNKVHGVTEGHPFVLSAYMATAYSKLKQSEKEIRAEHFEAADIDFVKRVLSHFFARFLDQAGKTSKLILTEIAKNGGQITLAELSTKLNKEGNELSPYLAKLTQDGAIIRINRGEYKLFHKLLVDYILT
ncbi:MAG: ATP-binding protein [Candidatus Diapherotrites archaeon]|uniref:ATP-binding protein n=1 Tax=Candidatus Iainarchaeum sp. TaxID=3101447 RepID=A0A8T3YLV3_9ARCH|nr:ATP-binding protein [Candidatus Diapherotrites archaeon]